jgi:hypothetical protein
VQVLLNRASTPRRWWPPVGHTARSSISVRLQQSHHHLFAAIPEETWRPIPYWLEGAVDVAEVPYQPFGKKQTYRLIVRRVAPTPGTQLWLEGVAYIHYAFITDRERDMLELEAPQTVTVVVGSPAIERRTSATYTTPAGAIVHNSPLYEKPTALSPAGVDILVPTHEAVHTVLSRCGIRVRQLLAADEKSGCWPPRAHRDCGLRLRLLRHPSARCLVAIRKATPLGVLNAAPPPVGAGRLHDH